MFSPPPLNEVDNSQINGKIDNSDTAIKIIWIGMFLKLTFINQLYMDKIFKSICVIIVVWNQDIVGDFVSKDKLVYIDYFRAVAIIFIVLGHSMAWGQGYLRNFNRQFFQGWTFAFVFIAGFLFQYLSYKFDYKTYLKKKFTNVIMPYLVIMTPVAFILAFTLSNKQHAFYGYSAPLRLVSSYIGGYIIQSPVWFVGMISVIFLLAPTILFFKNNKKIWYVLLCASFIYSVCIKRPPYATVIDQGWFALIISVFVLYLKRAAYFLFAYLIGMEFSTIFEKYYVSIKNYSTQILFVLMHVWVIISTIFIIHLKDLLGYQTLPKLLSTCLALLLLIKFEGKIKESAFWDKSLKFIANYSFGIFFIHKFFINVIRKHSIYDLPISGYVDVKSNTFQSFAISVGIFCVAFFGSIIVLYVIKKLLNKCGIENTRKFIGV